MTADLIPDPPDFDADAERDSLLPTWTWPDEADPFADGWGPQ